MLRTPKALGAGIEGDAVSSGKPVPKAGRNGWINRSRCGRGKGKHGRRARSHEHSPGVAVSGSQSRHFVQVRGRAKNSRVQAGQPLALQEIAAGPVDGREVEPDGTAVETQSESGGESRRAVLAKNVAGEGVRATRKGGTHVWTGIEVDCWPGRRLVEH